MKKIDWGKSIGILANVGVILGIVFLVVEINQNNALLAIQAESIRDQRNYVFTDVVLQNPELIELMTKDVAAMTEAERTRYLLMGIRLYMNFESTYDDLMDGRVEQDEAVRSIRSIYWRPVLNYGAPFAWQTYKGRAKRGFVEWMEAYVIGPGPP